MENSEEIKNRVDEIVNNPTTGTPHNRNVNELQGHAIKCTISLIETIEKLDKQNLKLEKQNINLQKIMLALTVATVILTIVQIMSTISST